MLFNAVIKTSKYLFLLLIVMLTHDSFAGETKLSAQLDTFNNCQFHKAAGDNEFYPQYLSFQSGDAKFVIEDTGKGQIQHIDGLSTYFKLSIPKDFIIKRLLFSDCLGDLLLIYEITNFESGSGIVSRLDRKTLQTKWQAEIFGFNIAEPLFKKDFLYLTSIGWAGKLNLSTGKYAWQHHDLYRSSPDSYNSFEKPIAEAGKIIFIESESPFLKKIPLRLVVDDITGRILEGAPQETKEGVHNKSMQ